MQIPTLRSAGELPHSAGAQKWWRPKKKQRRGTAYSKVHGTWETSYRNKNNPKMLNREHVE